MGYIGDVNFKGLEVKDAYLTITKNSGVQLMKGDRIHAILDLYASKEAYLAGTEPLVARYLQVSVFKEGKESRHDDAALGGTTLNITRPEVAFCWGKAESDEIPSNLIAQCYYFMKGLKFLENFKDDV